MRDATQVAVGSCACPTSTPTANVRECFSVMGQGRKGVRLIFPLSASSFGCP